MFLPLPNGMRGSASALRPPPPAAAARRTHLRAARSALAGCWLGAAPPPPRPRGRPASHPGPRAPPIRQRSPGLAPCRPLIGAPGRPLGREARRPSAALAAHGRRGEQRREGRRLSAREGPEREQGSESRGYYLPTSFPFGLPRPPGPDRRRAQPISVRGARGVSRASRASNRKGDVAR